MMFASKVHPGHPDFLDLPWMESIVEDRAEIALVVAANEGNIHRLEMANTAPDFTEMRFELEVRDLKHLNRLISGIKEKRCVSDVKRIYG